MSRKERIYEYLKNITHKTPDGYKIKIVRKKVKTFSLSKLKKV
jgi:hypothetical protein